MKKISMFAIVAMAFIACNNNKPDQDKSIMPENGQVTTSTDTTGTPSAPNETTTTTPTATGALNPEHGQPGHRCEIAVGAPLNSAPTTPSVTPTTTPTTTPVLNSTPPATTVPGISGSGKVNPPHGQPGHDCAVAVGAPLN